MPKVYYGDRSIDYRFLEKNGLKSHYITVQKDDGVVLKGKPITDEDAQKLILKKAKWILDKLELVKSVRKEDIVTGSRVQYLGNKYYVKILINADLSKINIDFTESMFKVSLPMELNNQEALSLAFKGFFKRKAIEKITPRLHNWSKVTGLTFNKLKFMQLRKRWGSCTVSNNIIINLDAIKLPFSLIDYLIVHELTHTKVKNHSKRFWVEFSKHLPKCKELDEKIHRIRL